MAHDSRPGTMHRRIGLALGLTGLIAGFGMMLVPNSDREGAWWAISGLTTLMMLGGGLLYLRGRQYASRADAPRILEDSKPDVLYLRAFKTDPSFAAYVLSSIQPYRWVSGLATEEEQLGEALRPVGDLVAIGQPGEKLPDPGAARIYASDDEWKDVVRRQMREARLVVIRAGVGENLLWELKQAVESLDPKKVLILVLGMKGKRYESFRALASLSLGLSLPERRSIRRFGRVSAFIAFSADWKPCCYPLRAPFFRMSLYKPLRRRFRFTLRPVLESFGLEWKQPGLSPFRVSLVAIPALIVFVALALGVASTLTDDTDGSAASGAFEAGLGQESLPRQSPPIEHAIPVGRAPVDREEGVDALPLLAEYSSAMNGTLPRLFVEGVALESMSAIEDALIYNYAVLDYAARDLDANRFLALMEPHAVGMVCGQYETRELLEAGISTIHAFSGRDSRLIGRMVISLDECDY